MFPLALSVPGRDPKMHNPPFIHPFVDLAAKGGRPRKEEKSEKGYEDKA